MEIEIGCSADCGGSTDSLESANTAGEIRNTTVSSLSLLAMGRGSLLGVY